MKSVEVKHIITIPANVRQYFPKWLEYHGRAIGGGILFLLLVLANFFETFRIEIGLGMFLSVLMILFGGSRSFSEVREQWFANDNKNVDYHYHSDLSFPFSTEPEDIEPDAVYFMTPNVPEYRWGAIADDFYVTDRLVINKQAYETGTWHFEGPHSSDESNSFDGQQDTSYSLYDMKTNLPTVRFKLKNNKKRQKCINVLDSDDDPSKRISLKAGFDEKIVTLLMSLDDKAAVTSLFTDDVLATIYDMFEQHPDMTEIECDNTQVVIFWNIYLDGLTDHSAISTGDDYKEMFDVMHEVVQQISKNLDKNNN